MPGFDPPSIDVLEAIFIDEGALSIFDGDTLEISVPERIFGYRDVNGEEDLDPVGKGAEIVLLNCDVV